VCWGTDGGFGVVLEMDFPRNSRIQGQWNCQLAYVEKLTSGQHIQPEDLAPYM